MKFVLIGDSITDSGNNPDNFCYVNFFTRLMTAFFPEYEITYFNRGISGNQISDLQARWQKDVLDNAPDILSVLIGINDLHRYRDKLPAGVSPEKFESIYDSLLGITKEKVNPQIILMQPFYLAKEPNDDAQKEVFGLLPRYHAAVDKMRKKYGAEHIPLHKIFQEHFRFRDPEIFCPEPVHPNMAGHAVIAGELLKLFLKQ